MSMDNTNRTDGHSSAAILPHGPGPLLNWFIGLLSFDEESMKVP